MYSYAILWNSISIKYLYHMEHTKALQNYYTHLNKRGLSVEVSLFNLTCSRVNTNPVAVNTDPIKAPPAIKRVDLLIARNK